MRFWTFFKTIFGPFKKLWTFQYAAGFRGPGILIKRSTIVGSFCICSVAERSRYLTKKQQIFKKYPKIDYRAFAFSHRHYAADNRTARDIQNVGPFWIVNIQGGQCPPGPPDKNIPAHRPLYACASSSKWSSTFLKIAPSQAQTSPCPGTVLIMQPYHYHMSLRKFDFIEQI